MNSYAKLKKAIDYMREGRAVEAGAAFASAINDDEIEEIYSLLESKEKTISTSSTISKNNKKENELKDNEFEDDDESTIKSIVRLSMEKGYRPATFEGFSKRNPGPLKIRN